MEKIVIQQTVCGQCSRLVTITAHHSPKLPPQGLLHVREASCPCGATTIEFKDGISASDIRIRSRRIRIKPFYMISVGGKAL